MRLSKAPKASSLGHRSISNDKLLRMMSEVISLREKVAQAELRANLFNAARADWSADTVQQKAPTQPTGRKTARP